jgi:phage FluMu protein Com
VYDATASLSDEEISSQHLSPNPVSLTHSTKSDSYRKRNPSSCGRTPLSPSHGMPQRALWTDEVNNIGNFSKNSHTMTPACSTSRKPDSFLQYLDLFRKEKRNGSECTVTISNSHDYDPSDSYSVNRFLKSTCNSELTSSSASGIPKGESRRTSLCGIRQTSLIHHEERKVESSDDETEDLGNHQCSECGKVFLHHQTLHAHTQMHLGRTQCPVCKKVFSNIGNKNAHVKTHHP